MAKLFPLADLRDPIATITGGRFPLVPFEPIRSIKGACIDWCADHLIMSERNRMEAGRTEPDRCDEIGAFSLDLTNEDTARWVDRKIAEALITRIMDGITVRSAVLGCTGDLFFLACVGEIGQHTELALRPHGEFACLASITPTEANIPTARAALLRALFGREKTS